MKTRMCATGNRGFTLVEIIVVVIIISVLVGMIVPGMYAGRNSGRLRSSVRQLLVTAQYARDFATTRRCKCRLTIDVDEQQYALAFQEDPQHNPSKFIRLSTGLGRAQRLAEGLRFGRVRIEPRAGHDQPPERLSYITFEPSGQADAAVLEVNNGEQTYSLLIAPYTGYAKLIEGTTCDLPNDRIDLDT